MKIKKPRELCILCENPINRTSGRRGYKERRSKQSITCSRKCARVYRRVYHYISIRIKKRIKRFKN